MRIRSFKPEIFSSEDITALSFAARWMFMGLLAYADDGGKARADPRLIKAAIYPIDDQVGVQEIAEWIEELEKRNMICFYWVGETAYLHVVNFARHQRIDKPSRSKIMSCYRPQHGIRMNGDRWVQNEDGTSCDIPPQGGQSGQSMEYNPRSYDTPGALQEPSPTSAGALSEDYGVEQGAMEQGAMERPPADPVAIAPGALDVRGVEPTLPGLDQPSTEPDFTPTQRLIAQWLEPLSYRPHPRTIGAVSKYLKAEIQRGIPEELLATAIEEWIPLGKSGVAVLRNITDGRINKSAVGKPHNPDHWWNN